MPETDMFGKPWPMQQALQQNLGGTSNGGGKRDQWSGKGTITGGDFGRTTGYDATNFNDPNMQTLKYQAGRINTRYDPRQANYLQQLFADEDFKREFPNARIVDDRSGRINYGQNDGDVDIVKNFGADNAEVAWQPVGGGDISPVVGGGSPTTSGTMPIAGQQSDLMAQLLEALQGQQTPDPQALLQQQLMR
jgi:hypothetical protein